MPTYIVTRKDCGAEFVATPEPVREQLLILDAQSSQLGRHASNYGGPRLPMARR
jgi:hypothetical protein